jgi:hypothetical protein
MTTKDYVDSAGQVKPGLARTKKQLLSFSAESRESILLEGCPILDIIPSHFASKGVG